MSQFLRCLCAFHLLLGLLSTGQTTAKSFQMTRAPNGTSLCALGLPSTTLNVSWLNELLVDVGAAPPMVLCGWKCTIDESCTSYNWRDDIQVCELYNYDPTNCSIVSCCSFYQMKNASGLCKLRETPKSCPLLECPADCVQEIAPDGCAIDCACPPSCETGMCSAGYECQLVDVTCARAPCFPQPKCVPVKKTCPTPKKPCSKQCTIGWKTDIDGCELCECLL